MFSRFYLLKFRVVVLSIPWFSPAEKIVKNKNAPGGLVPTLRGQILCTGIFHLVPNILIHYNRDRKKVPT